MRSAYYPVSLTAVMSEDEPQRPSQQTAEPEAQLQAQPEPSLRDAAVTPPRKTLAEILERLPAAPGVYIMKDRRGKAVYIGKAAVLRNRVRQYFQAASGDNRDFVPLLEGIVADIETVITSNEKEALLLENTLIKKHQPRFNVNLKDDKNYLVLRLDPEASGRAWRWCGGSAGDGAHYFGPYHSATSCREALRVVNRHFQLRTCTDHVLHNRRRPCLQYQIKRCPAPLRAAGVARRVRRPGARRAPVPRGQERRAAGAAGHAHEGGGGAHRQFERAADVRDQLRALETTLEEQRVVSTDFLDQDVFGFLPPGDRAGDRRDVDPPGQAAGQPRVLVHRAGVPRRRAAVVVHRPLLRPERRAARRGAAAVRDRRRRRSRPSGSAKSVRRDAGGSRSASPSAATGKSWSSWRRRTPPPALRRAATRARTPSWRWASCSGASSCRACRASSSVTTSRTSRASPRWRRWWCSSTAAPRKSRYRTYKVRAPGRPGSASDSRNDDFASMYEVLSRRFRRAREAPEGDDSWALPDLIVIDGGKGQLGMALAAARDVGIDVRIGTGLPIIGLAKERDFDALADGLADGLADDHDVEPPAPGEPVVDSGPQVL